MKTFEQEYDECMDKLVTAKKTHEFWAAKYTNLCFRRWVQKNNE